MAKRKGKRPKEEAEAEAEAEAEDVMSSLPNEVVCHILSLLPLKEAIKTCILSTRWREVYKSLPCLNMKLDDWHLGGGNEIDSYFPKATRFMDYVDWVLGVWPSPTHNNQVISIRCRSGRLLDYSRLHAWILSALQHDDQVRELHLDATLASDIAFAYPPPALPMRIFTLEVLTLNLKFVFKTKFLLELEFPPPDAFPNLNLKCLHLLSLTAVLPSEPDSFQRFISSCSALEELVMDTCTLKTREGGRWEFNVFNPTLKRLTIQSVQGFGQHHGIRIEAPNLVYFTCWNQPSRFLLKNLNSIAEVHFGAKMPTGGVDLHPSTVIQIFEGIQHAQSLHLYLSSDSAAVLVQAATRAIPKPVLPNLTCLYLDDLFVGIEGVVPCFPGLEALHLKLDLLFSSSTTVTLASKKLPSSFWSRLKTLKISTFQGKHDELQMLSTFWRMPKLWKSSQ